MLRFLSFGSLAALVGITLAGCGDASKLPANSRHFVPLSAKTESVMAQKGMSAQAPIVFRAYKAESELEVWKRDSSGKYALLRNFPICRWSGQLGPKKNEGDRQVPEGFYSITPQQLNPQSAYYVSFNVGYPNTFDRQLGRSGGQIMVHGACSSRGCFSMTDEQAADLYALAREAFSGGQKSIQFQSYPFRMNAQNLAKYREDANMPFWKNLKEGSDYFEVKREEPKVAACGSRYVFGVSGCTPNLEDVDASTRIALREKAARDDQAVAHLVQSGVKAVKRIYDDGDQHASFKNTSVAVAFGEVGSAEVVQQEPSKISNVSRPEALANGPREISAGNAEINGKASTSRVAFSQPPVPTFQTNLIAKNQLANSQNRSKELVSRRVPAQMASQQPYTPPAQASASARQNSPASPHSPQFISASPARPTAEGKEGNGAGMSKFTAVFSKLGE